MVAPFLNQDQQVKIEINGESNDVNVDDDNTINDESSNKLLDLTLKQLIQEWSDTMLYFIEEIVDIFNSNDYLRWQDKYREIGDSINKNRRMFYIGITFVFIALLLFYFELLL